MERYSEAKKPMNITSSTSFLSQETSYLVTAEHTYQVNYTLEGSVGICPFSHSLVDWLEEIEHGIGTPSANSVTLWWA